MMSQRKKLKINLILTLSSSAISLTSFLYLTYAWFVFPRVSNINALQIITESNVACELKYFTKNYTTLGTPSGYYGPQSFVDPLDYVTVDDYQSQFLPISQDPNFNEDEVVMTSAQFPGLRFTYALEVTGAFSSDKNIELSLTNFVSSPSATSYDSTSGLPITMSQATNMFATTIDGNGDVTSLANAFVTNLSPTDKFTSSAPSGPAAIPLASGVMHHGEVPQDFLIFLFTIEFSNANETYYSFSSSSLGIDYYVHDVEGSSNVYKNLSFSVTELKISLI